jgi:hypothetical protein
MKSILGFGTGDPYAASEMDTAPAAAPDPVRSLVSVRFIDDGRVLTYYNDRFALEPGDRVFVSGKLAGKIGEIEKVVTKFRINLADYQRVIAKAGGTLRGTFESLLDKMVSFDGDALSPDEFRAWILPPKHWDGQVETEEQIIVGDGYEIPLSEIEETEEVSLSVIERALDYCRSGRIAYVGVKNGAGTAFIEGSSWYEVNFRLDGDLLTEMYCECPYPGLCKHLLAVALTIRALRDIGGLDASRDFAALDSDRFWSMAARSAKRITL